MIDVTHCKIKSVVVHKVVSKSSTSANKFSDEEISLTDDLKEILAEFFFSSLKSENLFTFDTGEREEEDSILTLIDHQMEAEEDFLETSRKIAQRLHDSSTHPKVKDGDLYVVLFENCYVNDKVVKAIGLFKSEVKETYLNIVENDGHFSIQKSEGFSINKLDKGCLICQHEVEKGYLLSIFDNTSKARGANYWIDDFLCARVRRDSRFHTQNTMNNVREFITKELPRKKEVSKQEQIDVINKTVDYMKEKQQFDRNEYARAVLPDEDTAQEFREFLSTKNDGLDDWDQFPISEETVKKSSRFMKKVIKLDKDFSIYVHGSTNFMRKGYDQEKCLNYYQIYFTEEK